MFERMADKLRGTLADYEGMPQESAGVRNDGMQRENFFRMLMLERGVQAARADLVWVESVIQRIRDGEYSAP